MGLLRISLITWLFLLPFLHDFVWIFIQIPEGMDGPKKHETSARCRASRSVKQSRSGMDLGTSIYLSWYLSFLYIGTSLYFSGCACLSGWGYDLNREVASQSWSHGWFLPVCVEPTFECVDAWGWDDLVWQVIPVVYYSVFKWVGFNIGSGSVLR